MTYISFNVINSDHEIVGPRDGDWFSRAGVPTGDDLVTYSDRIMSDGTGARAEGYGEIKLGPVNFQASYDTRKGPNAGIEIKIPLDKSKH